MDEILHIRDSTLLDFGSWKAFLESSLSPKDDLLQTRAFPACGVLAKT
jgi:hypothetical protein